MEIAIKIKSRLLGEALCRFLHSECGGESVSVENLMGGACCSRPDIILLDHHSISADLLDAFAGAKFILLDTGLSQSEVVTLILIHRLQGVIAIDEDPSLLMKAMKIVHEGQIWINNHHLKALMFRAGDVSRAGRIDTISKREQEILDLLTKGWKNKEIAEALFMSEQTVKAHISHLFKKFHVTSRAQLISHIMSSHENTFQF
jgi:DNA-binding NarL/FixJ family response regulator